MILAHRGASSYAPENTMAAFYKAIELGANGIELDLHATKDGKLVVHHDSTVNRISNGTGEVQDLTFSELRKLDFGSWFHDKYKGEKIVSFEEFLHYFSEKGLYLAIEIKGKHIEEEVLNVLSQYPVDYGLLTITSFDYSILKKVRQLDSNVRIGYLTDLVSDLNIQKMKAIQAQQFCVDVTKLTKDDVIKARNHSFDIRTWNTKNEELMKHAVECGVDGMTINFPDKLVEYLKNTKQIKLS
ncbi:glycerophosphodiester phosphodiesterase [Bacillus sp. JJ1562]|uniref:glycerophosphodiester phosphodiesterase n=1 Tax=Bacillus sp. JJ1562 TaxID=3122960 RepID=UPI0030025164